MNKLKYLGMVFALLLFATCKKSSSSTQSTDFFTPVIVSTSLDLSFAQYQSLNQLQGYAYITGGNKGIVVYHTIDDQFVAWDRTCPVNPEQACAYISIDSVPTRYRCGTPGTKGWNVCCHSLFDATYGSPLSGEAKRGLKSYYTRKQGSVIYISSTP